jgi:hypothetical protein
VSHTPTTEHQEALTQALTEALTEVFQSHDEALTDAYGGAVNLVDGLVYGLGRIATALKYLGVGDAATPFGAIEALCMEMKESSQRIADGLEALAEAVRDRS